jgi:cell division protein FtsN
MLPRHPNPERDEPATSPALARRRDYMLRTEAGHQIEPRLVPAAEDEQPGLLPYQQFDPGEDEADPDIPPPPLAAMRAANDAGRERVGRTTRRVKLWPLAAGAVSVVALGAVAWFVYDRMTVQPGGGEVPYVAADAGPEKIPPQQEGGMEVPNQDIRVYNELDRSPPAKENEVLLPAPEVPVAPPAAADAKTQAPTEAASSVPSAATPTLDVAPAAGTASPPADAATAASDAKSAGAAATDEPVQTATTSGAFRIQLAAVKTRDAAQAAWKKMAKAHPDVLKGLSLNVVKVDRGADGALYRVQGGPFVDRDAAESACAKLKQKSQACLVVAP